MRKEIKTVVYDDELRLEAYRFEGVVQPFPNHFHEYYVMGASNKVCPVCGRKMKQQFIGLQHCKCGISWKKDIGFFERTSDMVFALERRTVGKKVKQVPVIRRKD